MKLSVCSSMLSFIQIGPTLSCGQTRQNTHSSDLLNAPKINSWNNNGFNCIFTQIPCPINDLTILIWNVNRMMKSFIIYILHQVLLQWRDKDVEIYRHVRDKKCIQILVRIPRWKRSLARPKQMCQNITTLQHPASLLPSMCYLGWCSPFFFFSLL
jgi:hypothetical protein